MEEFHHHVDLVIYDAPPLVGLADATLLTPQTDGLILIGRIDKTNSLKMNQALDTLKNSRVNVLGIVTNGHKNDLDNSY